jgi:hypothetical protein
VNRAVAIEGPFGSSLSSKAAVRCVKAALSTMRAASREEMDEMRDG